MNSCIQPERDPDSVIPEGYEHIVNVAQLQLVKEAVKEHGQTISYYPDEVDAYSVYEKLLEYQPAAYHAHKVWLEHDEKVVGEAIRFAILEARKMAQKCTHEIFSKMVVENLRRLS